MKRISSFIIALLFSIGVFAGQFDELADSAYMADQFAEAAGLYEKAAETDGVSSALYYNLGNCYYRMGKTGQAIVAYERALRLDPANKDARTNLEFVNTKIIDRPGDRGTFISNTLDDAASAAKSNTWAFIGLGLFVIFIGCIAIYVFSSSVVIRKAGFFGGILVLLASVAAIVLALRAASISTNPDEGIIIAPSTILSTSPRVPKDRNEEAMLLHEGTKVTIIDSVTTRVDSTATKWYDVQVDNNHRAWLDGKALQRI